MDAQDTDCSTKSVALFSANSSLQTGLLAQLIANELNVECNTYKQLADIPPSAGVLLIDCQGHELEPLNEIARELNNQSSNLTAALLNADAENDHESLLDWPCMSGIFYVDTEQQQLIQGLKRLLEGDYWVPRRLLHHFMDKNRKAPSGIRHSTIKLTKRERQILKLIKDGATNADISTELSVSEHTVKSHLYNVYKKIGVRNRLEASNWVRDLDEI